MMIATALKIRHSITVSAECERVWQAITEPEVIAEWHETVRFARLAVGAPMRFSWGERGEIVIVEPLECFGYRWQIEPDCPTGTLVVFTLESLAKGTRITVEESGFEALLDGDEISHDSALGWDRKMGKLEAYLGIRKT